MKYLIITAILGFAFNAQAAGSSKLIKIADIKNQEMEVQVIDDGTSMLGCVEDKTFFFSSKQQGTFPIRDIYRVKYNFPTLGISRTTNGTFLTLQPVAQYEGVRSKEHFDSLDECHSVINDVLSQAEGEFLKKVPAQVSMSLDIRMNYFASQQRCRRQVREMFSVTMGENQELTFLDILGLTQNSLAGNEVSVEGRLNKQDCFNLNQTITQ